MSNYATPNWCMMVTTLTRDALPTIDHHSKLELFGHQVAYYNPHITNAWPYRNHLTVVFPIWEPENQGNPSIACEINTQDIELVAVFNVSLDEAKRMIAEHGLEKFADYAKSVWYQPRQVLAKTA